MRKQHLAILVMLVALGCAGAEPTRSLAGTWRFALDRTDAGIGGCWYDRVLPGKVKLPGSLPGQGIGDPITTNTPWVGGVKQSPWFTAPEYARYRRPGNVKVPFWLQPETYYSGAAWYQRDIEIPPGWRGKRVVLMLERPHWETTVWVDDRYIGTNVSLSTPHEYDLGHLAPGKHRLTVRVDNRMVIDIGENSHAISDHTQGDWNGIVGKIELRATPPVWIDEAQVYPDATRRTALVKVRIGNDTGKPGRGELTVGNRTERVRWGAGGGEASVEVALGKDAPLWDEFHPVLEHLRITLQSPERDSREVTFGLRDIATDGTQFTINGRKTFFRGTLECCVFPRTGHPPTDLASWERIIRTAKAWGLNLIRFHSWCPPEAAFAAADRLGMYFQVETCWANQSTTLGDGKPVDRWVYGETDRILKAYGNHPSFMLMPYGNEPGGKHAAAYLAKYVAHYRALDPRRLWTSGSGWPQLPENQFDITPEPRIQHWGEGLKSRINAEPPATTADYRKYIDQRSVPVISHEIGQWCVYPNFDEIPQYTGYLKPENFEIFRDVLDEHGLGRLARAFLLASGRLQVLCYKEDIESALRTPGMGGFELLGLTDFPGQGTALVGVLDPFWEEKGYETAKDWRRFCGPVVPLARLAERVFTTADRLEAEIEVANFGPRPLDEAATEWQLVDDAGTTIASGSLPARTIAVDNGIRLGTVRIDLKSAPAPAHLRFRVTIRSRDGRPATAKGGSASVFENDWGVWIYPARLPAAPDDVLITARLDDAARHRLASGGKVLLTIPGNRVRNYIKDPVKLGFSSIFWNTAWTQRQAPTTLGILCDPGHPALAEFPTEFCSDWQWWYLIHRAGALRLDLLPGGIEPIVRVIDDWVTARPLGLIFEAKAARGRIIVCGFDLAHGVTDPVTRQMRASLLHYMEGGDFHPRVKVSLAQLESLFRQSAPAANQTANQ